MQILLLNAPHPSIGSRIPREHLPPLGLLAIGGPLLDAGHLVQLLDAELGPLSTAAIVKQVAALRPEAILLGHSGSTSGHPVIAEITRALEQGDIVKISSFGSFAVRQKGQRVGRNPKTGEEVPISPRRVLIFRASHTLKHQINGNQGQFGSVSGAEGTAAPERSRIIEAASD